MAKNTVEENKNPEEFVIDLNELPFGFDGSEIQTTFESDFEELAKPMEVKVK